MCYRIILLKETSKQSYTELKFTEELFHAIKTLLNPNYFWYDTSHRIVVLLVLIDEYINTYQLSTYRPFFEFYILPSFCSLQVVLIIS